MLPNPIFWNVRWYGVMIAIGLLACFAVIFLVFKKKKISEQFTDFVFYNGVASIVVGFVSAALFQSFYDYLENPSKGFKIGTSITFIGGLIGGAICFLLVYLIFRKKLKNKLVDALSIIPCAILIAHGFGRVGCFCAGCCYGKATDSIWGVKFQNLSHAVYPTQLYEAIFLFLLFGICLFLLLKYDFKHNLSVYLIAYGTFRFLIEYLRGDHRGTLVGGISPSQFWSLLMIVVGVGLIFLMNYLVQKRKAELQLQSETVQIESEQSEEVVEIKQSEEVVEIKQSQIEQIQEENDQE